MLSAIISTFAAISLTYYIRHLLFALAVFLFAMHQITQNEAESPRALFGAIALLNTLLYPYSRLTQQALIDNIAGDHIFIMPMVFRLFPKAMAMGACWGLAIFIAPVNLVYLFVVSRRDAPTAS